ncbi:MAG: hypothetical protein N2C12_15530 [Planctomycetales bacterium]
MILIHFSGEPMTTILLSADLMIASQFAGAAMRQQVKLFTVGDADGLLEKQAESGAKLVVIDLTLAGLEPSDLVQSLRILPNPPARILAFGPHVQVGLLDSARQAGCDEVVARSQFHSSMDEIIGS